MIVPGSANSLLLAGGGYTISRSVRLRSSASAYFNRTPASTTNRRTYTISQWRKRGSLGSSQYLISAFNAGTNECAIRFNANDTLEIEQYTSPSYNYQLVTTQVFRDPSAWYHIVVAFDTTQATSSDRIKLYVNGVQVTSFSTASYPSLNYDTNFNLASYTNQIGAWNTNYFSDGYLTEINFIDGQALTPSSFGENDAITGVWKPKKYTGTYGTNGFYLNFSDNSAATAAAIGKDYSGNGNNWTPNNISVTSGVTYDSMLDVPTPWADGGNGRGNYCTMNPLIQRWSVNAATFSEANLKVTTTNASSSFGIGTMFMSTGKWYWEGTMVATGTATPGTGVGDNQVQSGTFTNLIEYNKDGTRTGGASWATYTTNDVIGVAMDCDGGTISFYKNNALQGSINLTAGVAYAPLMDVVLNSIWAANFGQRPFTYTPPTGYVALNTQNLPTPTIKNGANYMAATLYTGNGTSQTVSNAVNNVSFQPDFVWVKDRTTAGYNHILANTVAGITNFLNSNTTNAESSTAGLITAVTSSGFSVGSVANVNKNADAYVGWQWQAGAGTTSSNTSGSITSTVSVGATQGFSVVTYTGTGANATVGHGLGVAPSMVIVKQRGAGGTSWNVYHVSTGNTGAMYLDLTNAFAADSTRWNNTSPTSTVFTVGAAVGVNASSGTFVAYCFAAVKGFSAFGKYTGNGSADGPFVYTGFRPRWVMIKRTDSTSSWLIVDTSRQGYNVQGPYLTPNTSDAETTGTTVLDVLSNGFKSRSASTLNISGGTYIYAAFAENPLNYSLAC